MREHAEKLEAVALQLAGVETLIDGLISAQTEYAPALMVINAAIDGAFADLEAVAAWMNENAGAVE